MRKRILWRIKKREPKKGGTALNRSGWQPRTLPPRVQGSTIRACGLNDRVRNGTGWTPTAFVTNTPLSEAYSASCYALVCACETLNEFNINLTSSSSHAWMVVFTPSLRGYGHHNRPFLRITAKPSTISTGPLQTLLPFHAPPINLVVS